MNFQLFKIKKEPDIDIDSLLEGVKYGSAVGDSKEIRSIIKGVRTKNNNNIYNFENFERKFQIRYLLRVFHNFLVTHKRQSTSVEQKNNSNLFLPNLNNNNSNIESQKNNTIFLKKIPLTKTNFQRNLERSNSTVFSQKLINKTNSKFIMGTIIDFNNTFHKKISNDAIFDVKKNEYKEAERSYRIKNKEARICFKNELNDIKNEKFPRCPQNNLFKEFDIKFNPRKMVESLKKESKFYQNDNNKNKFDRNIRLLLKEKHNNELFDEIKNKEKLKPSRRIIRNMVRKNNIFEAIENSHSLLNV